MHLAPLLDVYLTYWYAAVKKIKCLKVLVCCLYNKERTRVMGVRYQVLQLF